jgi:hypothetical protein
LAGLVEQSQNWPQKGGKVEGIALLIAAPKAAGANNIDFEGEGVDSPSAEIRTKGIAPAIRSLPKTTEGGRGRYGGR